VGVGGVVVWAGGVLLGVAFVVGYAGDVGEGVFGLGDLVAVREGFEAGVGDVGWGPEGEVVFLTHLCGWGGLGLWYFVSCVTQREKRGSVRETHTLD
jgi:hypothetical protein